MKYLINLFSITFRTASDILYDLLLESDIESIDILLKNTNYENLIDYDMALMNCSKGILSSNLYFYILDYLKNDNERYIYYNDCKKRKYIFISIVYGNKDIFYMFNRRYKKYGLFISNKNICSYLNHSIKNNRKEFYFYLEKYLEQKIYISKRISRNIESPLETCINYNKYDLLEVFLKYNCVKETLNNINFIKKALKKSKMNIIKIYIRNNNICKICNKFHIKKSIKKKFSKNELNKILKLYSSMNLLKNTYIKKNILFYKKISYDKKYTYIQNIFFN